MQTGELHFCHDWAAGSIDCDVGLSSVQLIIFSMVGEAVQLKAPCLAAMWSSTTRRRCLRPSFSLSLSASVLQENAVRGGIYRVRICTVGRRNVVVCQPA